MKAPAEYDPKLVSTDVKKERNLRDEVELPHVEILPSRQVKFSGASNAGSEYRVITKTGMRKLVLEFRKEVEFTIRDHVDGLH